MKLKIYILLLILTCTVSFAQKHEFLNIPKLTTEDVQSLKSKLNPEAGAEVLFRSVHYLIDDRGNIVKDLFERVKVYDKEQASNYLNKEVYVYESDGGARQVLTSIKANTFNIENGTVINTKIDKESKYRSKEDKNYTITKFAYPNVKNGSVLEYSYRLTSPSDFLMSIPSFTIEDEIPISYVEYVFDAPQVLGYNINYSGSLIPQYRDVSAKNIYGGNYKVYRFGYRNVPAYKTEEFVMNNDNYKTSIRSELNSTNFDNQFKSYSLSWEDIRKRLNDSEYFGDQLKKMDLVKDLLPDNIKAITSKVKRAEAILAFVQENFSWNNEQSLFTDKGIKNVLSTKTGNSAEINLLLCMLMRHTGLNANPVVLATPAKGLLLSYSPSMSQLNYVITSLETDGKIYIFDATSKLSKINMIPPRALNYNGVEMGQKETKILNIFYPDKSQTFLTVDAKLNPDGTFQGKFSDTDTKMFAMLVNERYLENKDEHLKEYKDQYKFPLNNIKSGLVDNGNFETSMDFTSDTFVDNLGSKLVFNPLLFLYSQKHSFNQTFPRKAPIELISGFDRIKKVTITLPEGFVFENVPKSKKIRTEDSSILYQYIVSLKGNQLTVETTTTVADSVFPKEYYPAFTQIFDNITQIEGQLVTAVKK